MTSSGNELNYTWAPAPKDSAPILIFEHGMLSTPEHFAWIVESLTGSAHIVTYARAGYGASRNSTGSYGIEESADDLGDLINDLPRETGPVFLAGHSLGGLIARRAAQVCNRAIGGIIYIDSSHPGQLARSNRQREGAVHLSRAFQGLSGSMRLGLGWLLEPPSWLKSLPSPVQDIALAQYRDSKLWAAGRAEWRSTQRYFAQARNQSLAAMDIPALVISAQTTLDADEVQAALHAELAGSHRQASSTTEVVIPGATHDSLLTNAEHASEVGTAIAEFLAKSGAAT
jgi:pimeloyl-ACP methyl ester carboxylesterase